MLFNYHTFIAELKENKEKKEVVEKYSKYYSDSINLPLEEQIWLKDFSIQFPVKKPESIIVPEELRSDFDWVLLQKLVASSFSSEGSYVKSEDGKWEFVIKVSTNDKFVIKRVSELWGFQILRLYEIYVEEQMNLQILIAEDEKERESILAQRKKILASWNHMLNREKLLVELELSDVE